MAADWKQHGPVIDLLDEFYCWKGTLKEYLQYVFMMYNIDQEQQDNVFKENDIKYAELLQDTIVACNCNVPVVPDKLDLFSVYLKQTDLLYKIIENRCKNSRPEEHVISLGTSLIGHDSKNEHMINSLIVQSDYPNSMFTVLSLTLWKLLLKKIGCDLMFYILDRMSLFAKMPKGCLVQICGKIVPSLEPKTSDHACKLKLSTCSAEKDPLHAQKREPQQTVQLQPNRCKAKGAEKSIQEASRECLRFTQLISHASVRSLKERTEGCTSTSKFPQKRSFEKAFNEPINFECCSEENVSLQSLYSKVEGSAKRRRVDTRIPQTTTAPAVGELGRSNSRKEECRKGFILGSESQLDAITSTVQETRQLDNNSCLTDTENCSLLQANDDTREGCYWQDTKEKSNHEVNNDASKDADNEELSPVFPICPWKGKERDSNHLNFYFGASKRKVQNNLDPRKKVCQQINHLENPPLSGNSNSICFLEQDLSQGNTEFTMISSKKSLTEGGKFNAGCKEEKGTTILTKASIKDCIDATKLTVTKHANATLVKEISEDKKKEIVGDQMNPEGQDECKDGSSISCSVLDMDKKSRKRNKFRKYKPLRAATKEEHTFKMTKIMYSSRVTEKLRKGHVLNNVPASKKGANMLAGKIFNLAARFKKTENNGRRGNNPTKNSCKEKPKVPKNLLRILSLLQIFIKKFKKLKVKGILELECPSSPTVRKLHKSYRLKRKKQWVQHSRFNNQQRVLFRSAILDYVPPYQVCSFLYFCCIIPSLR